MQPVLAPAPQVHMAQEASSAEQAALRIHLLQQPRSNEQQQQHLHGDAGIPVTPQHRQQQQHMANIDPAIAGSNMVSPSDGGSADEGNCSTKKGKRELSTSKRAAQNREAQRNFRMRKEGHIKKLEEQVRDYTALAENYKAVQQENYQLRDYIISLQSRLIESQGDFPQPPGGIALQAPRGVVAGSASGVVDHAHGRAHAPAPTAPMGVAGLTHLQTSAAQAVAANGVRAGFGAGSGEVVMQDVTDPALVDMKQPTSSSSA